MPQENSINLSIVIPVYNEELYIEKLFADILKLPTIWIPHSYLSCSQHAPNEHMIESVVKSGLKLMAGIFWYLGEKGTPN